MKYTSLCPAGLVAALAIAAALVTLIDAQAGVPLPQTVSIDENGHGSFTVVGGGIGPFPLNGLLAPDPGPGGLPAALTYGGSLGLTTGDVILTEAGGMSDLIRFNSFTSIVFYSTAGGGNLADTGFPSLFYTNNVSIAENLFGPTSYTPLPGQPGYNSLSPTLTFFFNSPSAVPESGSNFLLLAATVGGLLFLRRRLAIAEDVR